MTFIKAEFTREWKMVKEPTHMSTVISMLVFGKMVFRMEKEFTIIRKATYMTDNGKVEKKKVLEH